MSSWERGYGDFEMKPGPRDAAADARGTRARRCASPTCAGPTARRSWPRRARSCARSWSGCAERGLEAFAGTELEFIVFRDTYEEAFEKGYRDLKPANQYNDDYSVLGGSRVEPLMRKIRNQMGAARAGGRELQGRVQRRPARDQLPLRAGAADRRRALDLQDGREGDRRAGGHGDHVHGQVRPARGVVVPHPPLAAARRRALFARRRGLFERFVAGQLACLRELTPVLRAERQLLQALRERLVRADRGRLGPRQPHVRGAGRRPRRRAAARAAACRARTSTRTWRWRR